MNIQEQKKALRQKMRELLKNQQNGTGKKEAAFVNSLIQCRAYQSAASVLVYASMPEEAPTAAVIRQCLNDKKTTALPKIRHKTDKNMDFFILKPCCPVETQLKAGVFGIQEPLDTLPLFVAEQHTPILVLVPGLAFDKAGHRLGRGGGYYDRYCAYLKNCGNNTNLITFAGYCFSFQIAAEVPSEAHDLRMEFLITEQEVIVCADKKNEFCR